ncbi:MAG: RidA family protein [Sneathiella sp.]
MTKQYIDDAQDVPKPTSPIPHAVVVDNTCHISGQLSVYDDGYRSGTAYEEAKRAFELIFRIALKAGFEKDDLIYIDLAFSDLANDLPEVNRLYAELFDKPPARTIYEAAALPFGAKVKVQAIAMRASQ